MIGVADASAGRVAIYYTTGAPPDIFNFYRMQMSSSSPGTIYVHSTTFVPPYIFLHSTIFFQHHSTTLVYSH